MLNIQKPKRPSSSSRSSSCSDWSGTPRSAGALSRTFGGDSVRIGIGLHPNAKLEKMFPNDDSPNIVITCGHKSYSLNTAHLRLESTFFANISLTELNIDPTRFIGEHGEPIVERILRCLYGGRNFLEAGDVYAAYQLCKEWGIEKLVEIIQSEIVASCESFNFFMLLSLAVQFREENLLQVCQSKLESSAFSEIKASSQKDNKRTNSTMSVLPYPSTLFELDADALRYILSVNKRTQSLTPLETFSILKTYFAQNSKDLLVFCREFLPHEKLTSSEYGFIKRSLTPEEQFAFISPYDMSSSKSQIGKSMMTQSSNNSDSRICQLESENLYYQKRMREMELKNEELQSEMKRMKDSIDVRSKAFEKSETDLNSKLTFLESSIKSFESLEQSTKTEYSKTISKLKVRMREYEVEVQVKKEQVELLNSLLQNFQFQATANNANQQHNQQQNPPPAPPHYFDQNKASMTSPAGFFFSGSAVGQSNMVYKGVTRRKSAEQSMMTVQSYNYGNEGGGQMLMSEAIPIFSNLMTSQNQQQQNQFGIQQAQQQQLQSHSQQQQQHQQSKRIFDPPAQKLVTPEVTGLLKNRQVSILEQSTEAQTDKTATDIVWLMETRQQMQYEEETKTEDVGDVFASSSNNQCFVEFDVPSKVLDDAAEDYQSMLTNFFRLSLFKQMKLRLLYRSSADGFSMGALNSKVQSVKETLILMKSWEPDQIFGAFLSIPWPKQGEDQPDCFHTDENAFLFSITNNLKMDIINPQYALYTGKDFLFSLGTNDICIVEGGHESVENTSRYPCDYQSIRLPKNIKSTQVFAGNQKFQIDELEVYSIDLNHEMEF